MIPGRKLVIWSVCAIAAGAALGVFWYTSVYRPLRPGFTDEFLSREDGYDGLKEVYGMDFSISATTYLPNDIYDGLLSREVDVVSGFSTHPRNWPGTDVVNLEDDLGFFLPYSASPLARRAIMARFPSVRAALRALDGAMTNLEMARMVFEVQTEGQSVKDAARSYLVGQGLVEDVSVRGRDMAGLVIVASKDFTESNLLAEIMSQLIESRTALRAVRKHNLGGTRTCFEALRMGEVHVYPEYTGTLAMLMNMKVERQGRTPEVLHTHVAKAVGARYGFELLPMTGVDNSYTLTMRRPHAKRLRIRTISDLARYARRHR